MKTAGSSSDDRHGEAVDASNAEETQLGNDGRVTLLIGLPASGRSTVSAELARASCAYVIEPDAAKVRLPEYAELGATGVHPESILVAQRVAEMALSRGENIVLQVIGNNEGDLAATIRILHAKGYKVSLALSDLSPEEASVRAFNRTVVGGRFIPPEYILNDLGTNPRQTFDALKGMSEVGQRYVRIDQRLSMGTPLHSRIAEHGTGFDPHSQSFRWNGGPSASNTASPMSLGQLVTESMMIDVGELRHEVESEYPQQTGESIEEYMERTMPEVVRRMAPLRGTS